MALDTEYFEVNQDDDVNYVKVKKYKNGGFRLNFYPTGEDETNLVILNIKENTLRISDLGHFGQEQEIHFVDKFTNVQCELFIDSLLHELYLWIGNNHEKKHKLVCVWQSHTGEELMKALKIINNYEKTQTRLRLTTAGVMTKGLSKAAGRDFLSDPGGNLSRHVAEYSGLKRPRSPKSPRR